MHAPSPPRLALLLLRAACTDKQAAELRADLDEEFVAYQIPAAGLRAARRWYRRQVLRSLPYLLRRRFRRAPRPSPGPLNPMSMLFRDLTFAARALRARPLPTLVAVATLAMGIGATTAVFSALQAVVLRPLPYAEQDRLVRIRPDELFSVDAAGYAYFRDRTRNELQVAGYGRSLATLTGGAEAEVVRGALVSANLFDVLGAAPVHGRTFLPSDAEPGAEPTMLLEHGLWQRRFGGDPAIVGRSIDVSGSVIRVIGVMGPDHLPLELDWEFWLPLEEAEDSRDADSALAMVARLGANTSIEKASALTRQVFVDRMRARGVSPDDETLALLYVEPLASWILGETATSLRLLFGAVGLVLLIAAANVTNVQLAQGASRRRELAVRAALGASRGRLIRQLLTESLLLGVVGGVSGVGLAALLLRLVAPLTPADVPRAAAIGLDASVLAFAMLATLGAAGLSGIAPALRDSRSGPSERLRDGGQGSGAGKQTGHLAAALVFAEVALCVLLVVSSGLTLRSLWSLHSVDVGFESDQLVALRPIPLSAHYPEPADVAAYHSAVRNSLERLPSVRSVGGIMFLPMRPGGFYGGYWTPDAPPGDEDPPSTSLRMVTDGYFETMQVPLLAGRTFTAADLTGDEPLTVLNEVLAVAAFGNVTAPVGRQLVIFGQPRRVVGVVGNVRQQDVASVAGPEAYLPHDAESWRNLYFVARVEGDPGRELEAIGAAVRAIDPRVPITDATVVSNVVATTFASYTLAATLFSAFAMLALGLGLVGVYGVTSYGVVQRRREIGIRMALGAHASGVLRSTVLGGLRPVAPGLLAGWVSALAMTRWLSSLLYEIPPQDPVTFAAVPGLVLLTTVAALWLPARRAARVDPQVVLREG